MNRDEMVEAARAAALGAHAPYSNFRVGAIVIGAGGEVFTGANIENAAYPSSNCAEATAIGTAVSAGVRKIDTVAVACIDADDVAVVLELWRRFGLDSLLSDLLPAQPGSVAGPASEIVTALEEVSAR